MPSTEWTFSHYRDEYISGSGVIGYRGEDQPANCTWYNHMPAALIREKIGEEIWAAYFKFCVIRNPFDKAVSAFYFFRHRKQGFLDIGDPNHERAEFENWLQNGSELPIDTDKFMINGLFCLDEVVRYETLASDLKRICDRLSIPWDANMLPKLKSGIRPKDAKVEAIYTEKSRKIVETAYAFELDFFNYSFPGDR